jgi:hypothetical protein
MLLTEGLSVWYVQDDEHDDDYDKMMIRRDYCDRSIIAILSVAVEAPRDHFDRRFAVICVYTS